MVQYMSEEKKILGLIAGGGQFPILIAENARKEGIRVMAVAHQGETEASLADRVDEIVVAVPLGRRVILARGAVSSFWHFRAERPISDDDWRAMLEAGKAPAQPAWARPTARIKARKRKARARE